MGLFDDPVGYLNGGLYGPAGRDLSAYLGKVVSGQFAAPEPSSYDPNRSFAQNALDPKAIDQAMNVALSFGPGSIKAYHGSPYDFNAFDASKIGTGEGAQAYGHGLYFADNPNVARTYQSKVSALQGTGGPTVAGRPIDWNNPAEAAAFELMRHNGDRAAAADFWERTFKGSEVPALLRSDAALPEVKPAGHMYEVNIKAEPEQFLDWDKPLSQQPQPVQNAVGGLFKGNDEILSALPSATGESVSRRLMPMAGYGRGVADISHDMISENLRQAGIPGIRYLDQGSRGSGQGTSNYVVFDPSIVEILRKYGLGGLGAGAAATGGLYGDQNGIY